MGYLGYQKPQILGGKIYDSTKSLGTSGQVLSTNGSTGASWTDLGDGTLILNVSGLGISGSQSFTANQTSNVTFTVTIDSDSSNTGNTLVYRDGSGNFSAGTITANITGNLTGNVIGNVTGNSNTATTADKSDLVYVQPDSTNTNYYVPVSSGNQGYRSLYYDSGLLYNPSTNTLSATNIVGDLDGDVTGNLIGNADSATKIKTQLTNTNITHYPTFVDSNNSVATAETLYSDNGISYNPSTNTLATTTFSGNLTGNVTGNVTGSLSGTASAANLLNVQGTTANQSFDLLFTSGSGYNDVYVSSTGALTYNASTQELTAANEIIAAEFTATNRFTGNLYGNVTGNVIGNVTGNLAGTADKADDVYVFANNLSNAYRVVFVGQSGTHTQLFVDNSFLDFTYNPSSNTLNVSNIISSGTITGDVTGDLTGTADKADTILTAGNTTTNTNFYVPYLSGTGGYRSLYYDSSAFYYNPSTNTLYNTNLVGDVTGNVTGSLSGTASAANLLNINTSAQNQNYSLLFTSGSGYNDVYIDSQPSAITYNPSTNSLSVNSNITASTFTGNLTGNVTGNLTGTADKANDIYIIANNLNQSYRVTFTGNWGTHTDLYVDSAADFNYNPSTNTLSVSNISGDLAGTADQADAVNVVSTSGNANYPVTFVSSTSGYRVTNVDSGGFTYNPYTNILTVGSVTGDLTGTADQADFVNVSAYSGNGNYSVAFVTGSTGYNVIRSDPGILYNPSTNTLAIVNISASGTITGTFSGNLTGNVTGTADKSDQVYVNTSSANANYYIPFHTSSAGYKDLLMDSDNALYYNPGLDTLYSTSFSGNLTGNVTGNLTGTATNASNVDATASTTNNTFYVTFRSSASGSDSLSTGTGLTFNPSTSALVVGGTVTTNSDRRLKTDIQTIEGGLDKVLSMRGVRYLRKDTNDIQIGVIAQEVEEIIPEVVYGEDTKSVSYGNIVAVLIEAIKEQNKRIDELEFKLAGG